MTDGMTTRNVIPPVIEPLPEGRLEVITTHINADFDAVASMIAAGRLYPNAIMVFPGSQEKNLRNFYIQSVIYLFNVARIKDVDIPAVGRLILVDTRQRDRIGPLEKILENENLSLHIYDHHPDAPGDLKGEVEMVSQVGANATIMTELLSARGIDLTPEEATVLALGIYEDTGSFTFLSTTPRDYLAAAHLLSAGADLNVVSEMISRELTADQVALLYELINSARVHIYNGVEIVLAQAATEHYVDELAVLVHKMMDIQNLNVMIALVHMEGRVYMVARSRLTQVNVGELARMMGGGGHPAAAAATIKNMPLTQATDKLLSLLPAVMGPVRTARDIMVYPVISVGPDESLAMAREKMLRYNINVVPVLNADESVCGFISRMDVGKALHHGMDEYRVSDIMTTEFSVVSPEATFAEIQGLIVDRKQRILPVVEEGRPVGVITRTDLLNILTNETSVPGSLVEDGTDPQTGRTKRISKLMDEMLPRNILNLLGDIGRTADNIGFQAYAVGGFVRDIILRQENLDIDVVIEGDAIRFAEVFEAAHPEVRVRPHRKFNTAIILFPDGFKVDVTTARLEYYEHPAALPTVERGSLRLDMYRRDFTINTLAVALNKRKFGVVIDYFRGLRDLKDGYIRVLHNLSFVEDPTRVFRAIRFEQRFGFKIGKLTAALIQNAVKHDVFHKLSGKRLLGEIRLILREEDPGPALARMAEFDLLKFLHPNLIFDRRTRSLFQRIKKVRDWFDLTCMSEQYKAWLVYFLGLLNGMSQEEVEKISDRLIPLKREREIMLHEKPLADKVLGRLDRQKRISPGALYRALHPFSTESILYMMAKTQQDVTTKTLAGYFMQLRQVKTDLNGEDLIKMGFSPGPVFKKILDTLLEAKLNGELTDRSEEIEFVKKHFPENQAELASAPEQS